VTVWVTVPFAAVVFRAGLMDLPMEVLEAAEIDGAGRWQSFWRITLPLLRPVVLVLAVLIVVYAFRSFDLLYAMTQGGPGTSSTTLPYLAYKEAFQQFDFSTGAAVAVISLMIVSVLAAVYVRVSHREAQA